MNTLLNDDQKKIFEKFSSQKGKYEEPKEVTACRENDPFYDYFHERTDTNYFKLVDLSSEEFESLKDVLKIPISKLISNFKYLQELRYCKIETIADALAVDWVYFPNYEMRRPMLNFFKDLLGHDLNFIVCLTKDQKQTQNSQHRLGCSLFALVITQLQTLIL